MDDEQPSDDRDELLRRYEAEEHREPLRWPAVLVLLVVSAVFLYGLGWLVWLGGKFLEADSAAYGERLRGSD